MEIGEHWETIRAIFGEGYKSCVHYAFATVNKDGSPHVTPIGSLILRNDKTGFYFEEPFSVMRINLKRNPRVCILAVNANIKYWERSLQEGIFATAPAVRLSGTVGDRRDATTEELAVWREKIANFKGTKGYELLWSNMLKIREIAFDSFEPVNLGEMTQSNFE